MPVPSQFSLIEMLLARPPPSNPSRDVCRWLLVTACYCFLAAAPAAPAQTRMEPVFSWRLPDFSWQSADQRARAVRSGAYNPESALPVGIEVAEDRVFLSYGSFRAGSPATLTTVPRNASSRSPLLSPYPSWEWQLGSASVPGRVDCQRTLVSAVRVRADKCGRLWVVDGGRHAYLAGVTSLRPAVCPPKLLVFDLRTDQPLRTYTVPPDQYSGLAIPVSVAVDTELGCEDAFAFWPDSISYTVTAYSWRSNSSWVIRHPGFTPTLNALLLNIQGIPLPVPDGVYNLALSAPGVTPVTGEPSVFWHSLASFEENWVPLRVLRDPRASQNNSNFRKLGSRGAMLGQQMVGAVDSRGIMFYTLAGRDSLACWHTRHKYSPRTQAVLSRGTPGLLHPAGLTITPQLESGEEEVWMLSSGAIRAFAPGPFYIRPQDVNVQVHRGRARDLSRGSVCDSG